MQAFIASDYKLRYMYDQETADAIAAAEKDKFDKDDLEGGLTNIIENLEAIIREGHRQSPRPGIAVVRPFSLCSPLCTRQRLHEMRKVFVK